MEELPMKIDQAFDRIADTIESSDIYQNYLHVLNQVHKNKDINKLVTNIKHLQKRIVKETNLNNDISSLETKLYQKKKALYDIPLYQEYITYAEELNDMLKIVHVKLQAYIDDLNI